MHVVINWEQPIYMNVVDADIPNRIYLLNDVLQQTQILPHWCRYALKFDLEYN